MVREIDKINLTISITHPRKQIVKQLRHCRTRMYIYA